MTIDETRDENRSLDANHPLYEKSVVFTGKMAHLERKKAQDLVRKFGGKTPDSVNKKVDYLVIGDEGSPLLGHNKKSTKQKEAEAFIKEGSRIKIITESQFLQMAHETINL
jgi:NAD-dependent DNA ligase